MKILLLAFFPILIFSQSSHSTLYLNVIKPKEYNIYHPQTGERIPPEVKILEFLEKRNKVVNVTYHPHDKDILILNFDKKSEADIDTYLFYSRGAKFEIEFNNRTKARKTKERLDYIIQSKIDYYLISELYSGAYYSQKDLSIYDMSLNNFTAVEDLTNLKLKEHIAEFLGLVKD